MAERPTGTVTFLFTDIEGSTRLLGALGADGYRHALELTDAFADVELAIWTDRIAHPRIRTLVRRGLDSALAAARR